LKNPLITSSKGPAYKYRGLRKYFERVQSKATSFERIPTPDDWWDFWHYHADWPGVGNICPKYRLEHLKALVTVFESLAKVRDQFSTPFQLWIMLHCQDAGQDATFLHTPNGNGTEFPWVNPEIKWGVADLDSILLKHFPGQNFRVGWVGQIYESEDGDPPEYRSSYFLYRKNTGVSLE
jgi:hypothetical protein